MAKIPGMRKTLSAPGLLKEVRACFDRIEDPIRGLNQTDCLGLAVFGMKYPSLLKFDEAARYNEAVLSSDAVRCRSRAVGHCDARTSRRGGSAAIAALFHEAVPDFAARKGIGRIYLRTLRSFDRRNRIFFIGQSALSKLLRKTPWHHYLLSCWEPFWCAGRRFSRLRPILKKDGARKNDCEAATRLLEDVRREHPHLKLVEDGLASNGPHINLLKGLDLRFILGAKPGDHKFLFEWVNSAPSVEHREFTDENDIRHEFRYGVPLNDTHPRSEFSRILGETPKRQETTLGYGSANQRGERDAVDAHRTGALEDRERNFQYPEEPRLLL